MKITLDVAQGLLLNLYNADATEIFSVKVKKRSDGTIRDMVCRFTEGVDQPGLYDPHKHGLLWVLDMVLVRQGTPKERAVRSIALEGLLELKVHGVHYIITG